MFGLLEFLLFSEIDYKSNFSCCFIPIGIQYKYEQKYNSINQQEIRFNFLPECMLCITVLEYQIIEFQLTKTYQRNYAQQCHSKKAIMAKKEWACNDWVENMFRAESIHRKRLLDVSSHIDKQNVNKQHPALINIFEPSKQY